MINKTALINQHIYEIEKLRHDLIVTQTKNGLYLSEDRRAEIRHKSESKSGNLVDSRRKIEKEMDCYGSIKTGGVVHKTQSPETGYKTEGTVAGQCYSSRIYISKMEPQPRHSLIDFETSDDDEVIARGPPMLLTKTEQARELSKSSEQIKCEARVRVRVRSESEPLLHGTTFHKLNPPGLKVETVMSLNTNQDMFSGSALSKNVKYTSFAQVLQSVSSDELDYLVPENGPSVLWRLVCQSKLKNPMSLAPDERDYCTLKHNRWQLVQMLYTQHTGSPQSPD
ncbi:hypothetical protein PPACK8108_LOCUS1189 [Phakopsora pachyrhizi]|uniref:Uncharacterized protein n=1 Tax=Phakopsora pachyrhizi TaxID=170000 RepID=A0AAV0AHR1_PHAPC|nr:hypothetical protein PPACK8108_LOCUS1189 [Phakopsora pachyrhizi]